MTITLRRRRQIGHAIFDRFVLKYVLTEDGILIDDVIDLRWANEMARAIGCSTHALTLAIKNSCCRIGGITTTKALPKEEEDKVIWAISKTNIKGKREPLKDYKRGFGNLAAELNIQKPKLNLKTSELLQYAYPIYLEVIEEMFNS